VGPPRDARVTLRAMPGVAGRGGTRLPGVEFGRLQRHEDSRGSFAEVWRADWFGELPAASTGRAGASFVQANLSHSAAGVLRGLHYHRRQLDFWVVAAGRVFVALVDVRPVLEGTATRATVEARELRADEWVVIPAGVAHGFLSMAATDLLYFVTNEYDGSDELGFAWDDPAVGVPWPAGSGTPAGGPILSERDQTNPPLAELLRRLAR